MWFVCSVSWLLLLGCQYQCKRVTEKTRLRNDLQCVDGDVKPCWITHSLTLSLVQRLRGKTGRSAAGLWGEAWLLNPAGCAPACSRSILLSSIRASHQQIVIASRMTTWLTQCWHVNKLNFAFLCEFLQRSRRSSRAQKSRVMQVVPGLAFWSVITAEDRSWCNSGDYCR